MKLERPSWKEFGRRRDYLIVADKNVSQCRAYQTEEGTEKHMLYHCPEWYEVRREIPEAFTKVGAKSKNLKGVEVTKRYR